MSRNRDFQSEKAARFKERFPEVTQIVNDNLNRPFRPKRVINSAMLEAVMIALLETPEIDGDKLVENYPRLLADNTFQSFVTGGTTDTAILRGRITHAKQILSQ